MVCTYVRKTGIESGHPIDRVEMKEKARTLLKNLIDTPLFPLLFIQEWVKVLVVSGKFHLPLFILSIVVTVIWVWFGDHIYEQAEETVDNVSETVEEATDE